MVKRLSLGVMALLGMFSIANAEDVLRQLPSPQTTGGKPLMEAIEQRKTTREFSAKAIDEQTLSDILHVAWGISHEGKRTIPTAKNEQNLQVYAVMPDGTWLYNARENVLKQVSNKDLRSYFNKQSFMQDAVLTLLYVGSDKKYSAMHAGSAYQNVGLYAVSRGLNNVVRGFFDAEGIAKELGLPVETVIVSQTIGWPYM